MVNAHVEDYVPRFVDPMACNQFAVAPNCLAEDSAIVHRLHAETVVLRAVPDGANPEPAHNAIHFYRRPVNLALTPL